MAYTYILKCSDNTYYTGSTVDIDKRLAEHQSGQGANYTSRRLPVKLVYLEQYESVEQAFRREHQLKKWSAKKKEALIEENFDKLVELSKKVF